MIDIRKQFNDTNFLNENYFKDSESSEEEIIDDIISQGKSADEVYPWVIKLFYDFAISYNKSFKLMELCNFNKQFRNHIEILKRNDLFVPEFTKFDIALLDKGTVKSVPTKDFTEEFYNKDFDIVKMIKNFFDDNYTGVEKDMLSTIDEPHSFQLRVIFHIDTNGLTYNTLKKSFQNLTICEASVIKKFRAVSYKASHFKCTFGMMNIQNYSFDNSVITTCAASGWQVKDIVMKCAKLLGIPVKNYDDEDFLKKQGKHSSYSLYRYTYKKANEDNGDYDFKLCGYLYSPVLFYIEINRKDHESIDIGDLVDYIMNEYVSHFTITDLLCLTNGFINKDNCRVFFMIADVDCDTLDNSHFDNTRLLNRYSNHITSKMYGDYEIIYEFQFYNKDWLKINSMYGSSNDGYTKRAVEYAHSIMDADIKCGIV